MGVAPREISLTQQYTFNLLRFNMKRDDTLEIPNIFEKDVVTYTFITKVNLQYSEKQRC